MPPKKPVTSAVAEEALARRVKWEREHQDPPWSPAGLASRMTNAGYPMSQATIWKIENPDSKTGKRRRITLDEAVAFARVFGLTLEDLTQPPEVQQAEQAAFVVREMRSTVDSIERLYGNLGALWGQLTDLLGPGGHDPLLVHAAVARAVAENPTDVDPWQRVDSRELMKDLQMMRHPSKYPDTRKRIEAFIDEIEGRIQAIGRDAVGNEGTAHG